VYPLAWNLVNHIRKMWVFPENGFIFFVGSKVVIGVPSSEKRVKKETISDGFSLLDVRPLSKRSKAAPGLGFVGPKSGD